jgi:hypothetical protein
MNDPYVLPEVCISLGLIVVAWRYGFEPLRRDEFRCQIRRIRDDLFDFMWKNDLECRDTAYQDARAGLNAVIYMGGAFSPTSIIATIFLAIRRIHNEQAPAQTKKSTDPMIQEAIDLANKRAVNALLTFLFLQGPFGLFIKSSYWLFCAIKAVQRTKQVVSVGADYVISHASILIQPKMPVGWTR